MCEFYPRLAETASYFTVTDTDLSGYEIYLSPRYKYGGSNAASLSNSNDILDKIKISITSDITAGSEEILTYPTIESGYQNDPSARGDNSVIDE